MAGKYGIEGCDAVGIGVLDTAEKGGIPAAVGNVSGYVDAAVYTCCVGVPDVDVDVGNG